MQKNKIPNCVTHIVLGCALLTALQAPSYAKINVTISPIAKVPEGLPTNVQSKFTADRLALKKKLQELITSNSALEAKCTGVTANTTCDEEEKALARQAKAIAEKITQFNADVAAARSGVATATSSPLSSAAKVEDVEQLKQLKGKLEAQLAKVQKWIAENKRDQAEFEKIRKEAEIDLVDDVLKNIPAGDAFEGLAKVGYLNHHAATALKYGYDALTDYLEAKKAFSATNDGEKLAAVLDARKTLRDAMMDGAVSKLDPKAQKWLKGMEKVFDSAAEDIATAVKNEQAGKTTDKLTTLGQALVQVGTTIYPPADLIVKADAVGEKVGQRIVIQPALTSLNEAVAGEFKAEQYLRGKITQVNARIAAAQAAHH